MIFENIYLVGWLIYGVERHFQQTTIYKTLHRKRTSNTNPAKKRRLTQVLRKGKELLPVMLLCYYIYHPCFIKCCDLLVLTKNYVFVCLMVFNATLNNISVISWRSVLLVEENGGPGENHRPVASH